MNITSITNGRIHEADNHLLRAWRNGELDASQADALETRLFFEPDLAEAASIDQDISEGMSGLPLDARPRTSTWPMRSERILPLLAAASIGAMAVLVPVAFQHDGATTSTVIMGNVEWVRLDHVRGSEPVPTLVNPASGTGALVMELPAPAGEGPFEARVISADNASLAFNASPLHAVDGALTLLLPRDALQPGDYRIELRSLASTSGAPESLRFRFRP